MAVGDEPSDDEHVLAAQAGGRGIGGITVGFYDERCMATGVSLRGSRAVLVLLGRAGVSHYPIALAVKGTYNRLGSIDGIEEDDNTALIHAYFLARLEAGDLVLREYYARQGVGDIEALLGVFERNVTQHEDAALLSGRRPLFALLDRHVWDAAAGAGKLEKEPDGERFRRLFLDVPQAEAIYRGSLGRVSAHLKEMARVCAYLGERGVAWRPRTDEGQHGADEMRPWLADARHQFHDSPLMLKALAAYEAEMDALLEDD